MIETSWQHISRYGLVLLALTAGTFVSSSAEAQTESRAFVTPLGQMRLLGDSRSCLSQEQLVTWAIQGPVGPAGPQGPTGASSPKVVDSTGTPLALAELIAASVTGQTVAANFDELRFKVKAGDTVYITEASGTSEEEARILNLSASSLAVSMGGVRRDLVVSNVGRIRQRLPDSKKNGALIGFLAGAAASTAAAKTLESPSGSCSVGCVAVNVLYGGGLGALVGLGIDALIQSKKDIYLRSPTDR